VKILLINPKFEYDLNELIRYPPLGLAYVAGALQAAGHDVQLFDQAVSKRTPRDIIQSVERYKTDIVGITASSCSMRSALGTAKAIRESTPGIKTIFGGVHPTLFPGDSVAFDCVDYVVHGEGEETVPELMDALENGKRPEQVLGVAYKRENQVIVNSPRPLIKDLDTIPFPAYELLPMGMYGSPQVSRTPFATMITSRGCPFSCIFCDAQVVLGKIYRGHSPERILEEIHYLKRSYGIREIMFKDSEFTLDKKRVEKFCELIMENNVDLRWTCNGRVGSVNPPLLQKMRRAGCRLIQYGVESGDQEILNTLRKQITVEQVKETFRVTREAGIKTTASFMIGNPGERRESIERTIKLSKELKADFVAFHFCTPFPGTELHRMALDHNWMPEFLDYHDLRPDRCVMNATNLSTEELTKMRRKAYQSFYLRPSFLVKRFLTLRPHDWKMNLNGLANILKR